MLQGREGSPDAHELNTERHIKRGKLLPSDCQKQSVHKDHAVLEEPNKRQNLLTTCHKGAEENIGGKYAKQGLQTCLLEKD